MLSMPFLYLADKVVKEILKWLYGANISLQGRFNVLNRALIKFMFYIRGLTK